ncbi:MAG: hypothetical protein JKY49_05590 [Cohaesibacteraceae bacterium]|nr:hypothetical protein [Cohaesibacteraceae bacterium]MBL4876338.1 hypothetical protein [Cohaesibacteraceae bacterium]
MKFTIQITTGIAACIILFAAVTSASSDGKSIRLLVPQKVQLEVLKWAAMPAGNFRNTIATDECLALDDPKLGDQLRIFVELMIWCQAIKSSGIADNITLIPFPGQARAFALLKSGQADGFGNSLFRFRVEEKADILNFTSPVIAIGDYQVGLFTAENRKDVLNVRTKDGLAKLTGITVSKWVIDRKTMYSLTLERVQEVMRWELIAKMIAGGRADFTFSRLDRKTFNQHGIKMIRIEGLKASLQGVRVLITRGDNKRLFTAVQNYISANTKAIRNAFVLSNFITSKYADWPDVAASSSDGAS